MSKLRESIEKMTFTEEFSVLKFRTKYQKYPAGKESYKGFKCILNNRDLYDFLSEFRGKDFYDSQTGPSMSSDELIDSLSVDSVQGNFSNIEIFKRQGTNFMNIAFKDQDTNDRYFLVVKPVTDEELDSVLSKYDVVVK